MKPDNQINSSEETDKQTEIELSKDHIISQFHNCSDLTHRKFTNTSLELLYFKNMVDEQILDRNIVSNIRDLSENQMESIISQLDTKKVSSNKEGVKEVLNGNIVVFYKDEVFTIAASSSETRPIEESETESIILGPHVAFIESSDKNISLIRKRVKSSHLKSVVLSVGEISKTNVTIMYIEDIANVEFVELLKERINSIEIHGVLDTNVLVQLIDDNPYSPFPQFFVTERPDVVASKLFAGKVIGIIDESPYVFCSPSSFFDFMQSPDDYTQRWITSTFIRLLRYFALFITLTFSAFYVGILTYHYEMIPQKLLPSIIESRSKVPFPPIYEALFLELVIEFLREAGARLPTKIGQTIGIVGGIVIGQAAVEAGITSNILIIVVATSAIASFVIPSYLMSGSIRIIRFCFILIAAFWGNIGLAFGIGLFVIHLNGITNLKAPYFIPVSPTYFGDWIDTIIRAPFSVIKDRPVQSRSKNKDINKMKK
ncbi:spore germination protein [Bacillus sp. CHD6a]|uniref:spore germination protein n=1 Tax=Bacillus sp. CHD6a TaxID=1643452 RepID=UPI0006CE1C2F|nr:spore germination protein [Bacillus sp. CHD6a]KPB06288.1 spore gernimation protein GerA [Bacillus sp. CHD6a]